ncbi:uncharacterized protein LOC143605462 [Bidens hawaiensis]|uniref:uncharacterized protein LOC143605462 n=1 Tax=Bidens hawaiensis TaxID=980011 RepID=UPI0040498355
MLFKFLTFVYQNYTDQTLTRFLIARSMDPNKAAKMFVSWRKWQASFVPLGVVPDSEVVDELEAKKIYLQGLSKEYGCPVVVCKAHKHYPAKDQPQFKKFVVHLLDKAIASGFKGKEIGDEKIIAILDLDQIGYNNVDARGFITGFQFLQVISKGVHGSVQLILMKIWVKPLTMALRNRKPNRRDWVVWK